MYLYISDITLSSSLHPHWRNCYYSRSRGRPLSTRTIGLNQAEEPLEMKGTDYSKSISRRKAVSACVLCQLQLLFLQGHWLLFFKTHGNLQRSWITGKGKVQCRSSKERRRIQGSKGPSASLQSPEKHEASPQ